MVYYYIIDLNERGQFYAHVEDERGKVVYDIDYNEIEFLTRFGGYMAHLEDVVGLEEFLIEAGYDVEDLILVDN